MLRSIRWWWASVFTMGALMLALAGSNSAQDKKAHEKHDGGALYLSLREVINNGAKLFNEQGDHAGCYRLYQGSLIAVRPFLPPELQTRIDSGMTKAEGMTSFAGKAFKLREVLDDVRSQVKPANFDSKTVEEKKKIEDKKKIEVAPKTEEPKKLEKKKVDEPKKAEEKKKVDEPKKVEEKKKVEETKKVDEPKKVEEKKKLDEPKKADEKKTEEKTSAAKGGDKGKVSGKITLQGKALTGGYFVTLIGADGKKFSSAIQKDGSYQFKTGIPAGEYRVAIEPIPGEAPAALVVPARYRTEIGSGITLRIKASNQEIDLNLVN